MKRTISGSSGESRARAANAGQMTTGLCAPSRESLGSPSNAIARTTGTLVLTYFTAERSEPVTKIRTYCSGTAAGLTPTLSQCGIFSEAANGDLTLVAFTSAADTALWNAASTEFLKDLNAALGLSLNQRYAEGELCISAATMPTARGTVLASGGSANGRTVWGRSPRMSGRLVGQTSMPASILAANVLDWEQRLYFELVA